MPDLVPDDPADRWRRVAQAALDRWLRGIGPPPPASAVEIDVPNDPSELTEE